jgi:TolA-binding protein
VVLPELALLRLDEGNTAGAKAALEQLRGDEARAGAALYVRALVAAREGDRATARALLEEFLSLEPDAPEAAAARKLLEELAHPSQP